VQFPYADAEKAFSAMMPPSTATVMVELYRGINDGLVAFEKAPQRTKTTLEDFIAQVFVPAFRA
jgi:hypothetical protein